MALSASHRFHGIAPDLTSPSHNNTHALVHIDTNKYITIMVAEMAATRPSQSIKLDPFLSLSGSWSRATHLPVSKRNGSSLID